MSLKKISAAAVLAIIFASAVSAQNISDIITVVSPAAWTTLRSDSVTVSVLANPAIIANRQVNFRVVKRTGTRSSTLFTKNVSLESATAEIFLGKLNQNDIPLGGNDFLSIEWSIAGDANLKGTVEPVGVVIPSGVVSEELKWIPAEPPLAAIKLADDISAEQVAEQLANSPTVGVGGTNFSAGWNSSGLFISFPQRSSTENFEFALDMKVGKGAFLAWADRFIVYNAASDSVSVYGLRYNSRASGQGGITRVETPWGQGGELTITKVNDVRVIYVSWNELGIIPFDGRNIGFSVFAPRNTRHPRNANRHIPGTWGSVTLQR